MKEVFLLNHSECLETDEVILDGCATDEEGLKKLARSSLSWASWDAKIIEASVDWEKKTVSVLITDNDGDVENHVFYIHSVPVVA